MISKISAETKDAIKRKSAYSLPDRPSDQGMKPDEIKRAFWQPIVDVTYSALGEIDRVIDEVNEIFNAYEAHYETHMEDNSNPHHVTKAQVGLGNCDNTADIDKPMSEPQRAELNAHNAATDAHNDIRGMLTEEVRKRIAEIERVESLISGSGTVVYVHGNPVDTFNADEITANMASMAMFAEEATKASGYTSSGAIAKKIKELEERLTALENQGGV